ncbi:hypothetical protein E2C01_008680 [Portunus trituberculatus]|uniref:Uncharacterized protein n=1 Tax=Portunus trituberculatus TaxID=210409 RepID=A0A5B7D4Z9_PORTR|nr:hypothetical protein [Portunus trituberculatus]
MPHISVTAAPHQPTPVPVALPPPSRLPPQRRLPPSLDNGLQPSGSFTPSNEQYTPFCIHTSHCCVPNLLAPNIKI